MTTATLKEKRWCGRTLIVACDGENHTVQYTPWGLGRESVLVDGVLAVSREGGGRMSHGYRFRLGESLAALSIAIPWWGELFPLCDLSFARLEIDGAIVYEEGRAPNHPLQWTVAAGGFLVVQPSLGRGPSH